MIFSSSPVIENLPVEMRERLTEMRETDLQVQSKFFFFFFLNCLRLELPLDSRTVLFFPFQTLSPLENPRLLQKVISLVSCNRTCVPFLILGSGGGWRLPRRDIHTGINHCL